MIMNKFKILLPIIAGAMWGSAGVFVRFLDAFGMDSLTILLTRTSVASLVLCLGMLFYDKNLLKIKLKDFWIFLISGLAGTLGLNLFYNAAIKIVTLSMEAVLLSLSPVFVVILAGIFFHEKITGKEIFYMALALVGSALASGLVDQGVGQMSFLGITLGLGSALCYAIYSMFSKLAMDKGYDSFTITLYNVAIIAIVLLPFSNMKIIGEYIIVAPVSHIIFMIVHALVTGVLPYVIFTLALASIPAGRVSILSAGSEPAAAAIAGMIFFGEKISIFILLGMIITVIALSLLCIQSEKG